LTLFYGKKLYERLNLFFQADKIFKIQNKLFCQLCTPTSYEFGLWPLSAVKCGYFVKVFILSKL